MLIGLISDTHIPTRASGIPGEVARAFQDVEMILCAGDLEAASALDELEAIAAVTAVAGNMDRYRDPVRLPDRRVVEVEGHRIGLTHGWGGPDGIEKRMAEAFAADGVEAVVFGHSHRAVVTEIGGVLLVNPGSPTDTRFATYRSVGLMRAVRGEPLTARIVKL